MEAGIIDTMIIMSLSLHNPAYQVPAIHRVSFLHFQIANLPGMRGTDDHFLREACQYATVDKTVQFRYEETIPFS